MKFNVRIGQARREVGIDRLPGGKFRFQLDGKEISADIVEIPPNGYSILIGAAAFEIHVSPAPDGLLVRCDGQEFHIVVEDPRSWRRGGSVFEAEGRQQVIAPMPGKVVRVLIAAGDEVQTKQGLVVVEAMKMQNEIRAPKHGKVARIFVKEGQAVSAGEPLVTIT